MPLVKIDSDDLQNLAEHAIHHANCNLNSWNKLLTKCQCGLFQLLTKLEKRGLIKTTVEKDATS